MQVLVAWLLAAAPVLVDPGVSRIEACRVAAVAFRTPDEAWAADACGQVFRSTDGGRGWQRQRDVERALLGHEASRGGFSPTHTSRITWLSAQLGLAFVYGDANVYRTTDGGATWTKARAGTEGYVYAVESVGSHLWVCDSSGRLRHSADRGARWEEGPKLFDKAGVNPVNWCASLSFVDAKRGWALGWKSLWQTVDGGAHWTELSPPPASRQLTHLVRVTEAIAWATDDEGTRYVTRDGAASWRVEPAPSDEPPALVRRPDGRAVLVDRAESDATRWVVRPSWEEDVLDSGPAYSPALAARLRAIRTQPLLTPPSGKPVALTQVSESAAGRWGVIGRRVFHAEPEGEWFAMAELPAPAVRIAALESGGLLVRTADALLRGDGQAPWRAGTAVDELDWERLTRGGDGGVRRQLACLETGRGTLSITREVRGCFGGSTDSMVLELGPTEARWLTTSSRAASTSETLTLAEARALVRRVAVAVARADDKPTCWSTTSYSATLAWQCDGGLRHTLAFETSECGPVAVDITGGETRSRSGPSAYSRVHALLGIAATPHGAPDAGP